MSNTYEQRAQRRREWRQIDAAEFAKEMRRFVEIVHDVDTPIGLGPRVPSMHFDEWAPYAFRLDCGTLLAVGKIDVLQPYAESAELLEILYARLDPPGGEQ